MIEKDAPERLLTIREREVLTLLAMGEDNSSIAAMLFIAPETVRSHTRSAKLRLRARSRSHAIALALQQGELDLARQRVAGYLLPLRVPRYPREKTSLRPEVLATSQECSSLSTVEIYPRMSSPNPARRQFPGAELF